MTGISKMNKEPLIKAKQLIRVPRLRVHVHLPFNWGNIPILSRVEDLASDTG
ncbi:MAG: hypothetical protein ACMUIU_08525 [bacterium]